MKQGMAIARAKAVAENALRYIDVLQGGMAGQPPTTTATPTTYHLTPVPPNLDLDRTPPLNPSPQASQPATHQRRSRPTEIQRLGKPQQPTHPFRILPPINYAASHLLATVGTLHSPDAQLTRVLESSIFSNSKSRHSTTCRRWREGERRNNHILQWRSSPSHAHPGPAVGRRWWRRCLYDAERCSVDRAERDTLKEIQGQSTSRLSHSWT